MRCCATAKACGRALRTALPGAPYRWRRVVDRHRLSREAGASNDNDRCGCKLNCLAVGPPVWDSFHGRADLLDAFIGAPPTIFFGLGLDGRNNRAKIRAVVSAAYRGVLTVDLCDLEIGGFE